MALAGGFFCVMKPAEEEKARERQACGQGGTLLPENLPEANKGDARDLAAAQVAEWVELTGEVSGQVDQKPQGGRPEGGVSLAARQLPVDGNTDEARRSNIRRSLKVASLSPEAQDVIRRTNL